MKVVIFSDVHGHKEIMERIVDYNPDADYILSLGDSELPYSELQKHDIICVKGNYPFDAGHVYDYVLEIAGKKIFMTHGHKHKVRQGEDILIKKAIEEEFDIILYGHTHIASVNYKSGKWIFNPGSCYRSRNSMVESYLILEIEEGKEINYHFRDAYTNQDIVL